MSRKISLCRIDSVSMEQLSSPWTEDPEFVRLYDVENQGLWDADFYRELLLGLGVKHVLDIGCGTGVFAVELARRGLQVTGVDPSAVMLAVAEQRVRDAGVSGRMKLIQGTVGEAAESSLRSLSSIASEDSEPARVFARLSRASCSLLIVCSA